MGAFAAPGGSRASTDRIAILLGWPEPDLSIGASAAAQGWLISLDFGPGYCPALPGWQTVSHGWVTYGYYGAEAGRGSDSPIGETILPGFLWQPCSNCDYDAS